MPRVANSEARALVTARDPFKGNNTYGRQLSDGSYAAFSYGEHWPLYVWWRQTSQWYGNANKYSRTTTKHAGQLRPHNVAIRHLCTDEMCALVDICENEHRAALLTKLLSHAPPTCNAAVEALVFPATGKRRLLPLTG